MGEERGEELAGSSGISNFLSSPLSFLRFMPSCHCDLDIVRSHIFLCLSFFFCSFDTLSATVGYLSFLVLFMANSLPYPSSSSVLSLAQRITQRERERVYICGYDVEKWKKRMKKKMDNQIESIPSQTPFPKRRREDSKNRSFDLQQGTYNYLFIDFFSLAKTMNESSLLTFCVGGFDDTM